MKDDNSILPVDNMAKQSTLPDPDSVVPSLGRLVIVEKRHGAADDSGTLVSRIRNGDRVAERELVERYSRGLRALLRRYVQDEETAQDLHQDTFIVVICRLRDRGIDYPQYLKSFIRQTAINLAKDYFRKNARRQTEANTELVELASDMRQSLFDKIADEELLELVGQLVNELVVERDREILERFYFMNQDRSQICSALKLSGKHFYRVMFRARKRLKQLVEKAHALPGPAQNTVSNPSSISSDHDASSPVTERPPGDSA